MPDFAPNFTPRIKIRYSSLSLEHSMQFRVPRGTTAAQLLPWYTKITNWLNAVATARFTDWTMLGTQYADTDSDLFFPVASPAAPNAGVVPIPAPVTFEHQSRQFGFAGRSVTGLRAVQYLITVGYPFPASAIVDARVSTLESAGVTDAVNALNASPAFVANDNGNVIFYPYVNLKQNSYWSRRARG